MVLAVLLSTLGTGVRLSVDSLNYVSMSRNLLSGEGIVRWDGGHSGVFPPLFPVLLAIGSFGMLDPIDTAVSVNAILFGGTVALGALYVRRRTGNAAAAFWVALGLVLGIPLINAASAALSEMTFIFCCSASLIALDEHLRRASAKLLLCASAFAGLACLSRHAGAALVGCGLLLLVLPRGASAGASVPFRQRVRDAALFGLVAAGPLGLWLLRNALVEGSPTEGYAPSTATLGELATSAVQAVAIWALPPLRVFEVRIFDWIPDVPSVYRLLASCSWLAVVAALGGVGLAWHRSHRHAEPPPTWVFGTFIVGYAAFMFYVCMTVRLNELGDRLLSPLYVPMLIVAGIAIDGWLRRSGALGAWAKRGVWVLALGWIGLLATYAYFDVRDGGPGGSTTFRGGMWTDSPTVQALRDFAFEGPVLSNRPGVAYIHMPHRNDVRPLPPKEADAERLLTRRMEAGWPVNIVWFDHHPHGVAPTAYGAREIRAWPNVWIVEKFRDGAWFRTCAE